MDETDERKTVIGGRRMRLARRPTVHPDHVPVRRLPAPMKDDEGKAKATVARGRTIIAPMPDEFDVIGYESTTGEPVRAQRQRSFGPGETVELSLSEIARLTRLGFLHDPSRYATDEEAAALPPPLQPPAA
jgi:hypothetical protein